jgi:exopolysaccharide production protein ExoQ
VPAGSEVRAAAGYIGRFDGRALGVDACLAVTAIASVVAIPVLHSPAALLFLVSGVLLAAFRPAVTAATLLDCRMVLILPAFCILSTIWSLYPALSLRFSIQLAATVVIAILVARRLAFQTTILAVFLALFPCILLSLALGPYRADTGALVGMFGSKNEMGGMSALFALIGFGLVAARSLPRVVRFLGAGGFLLGLAAILLAQSLGALAYLPTGIAAYLAILLARRMHLTMRMVILGFAGLATLLIGVSIAAHAATVAQWFFEVTGKDLTLTGRVDLWEVALNLIAERPFLGTGYQAFWVRGHAPAEALWDIFGIESRSGFNFHNTYLSNAVEIGLLGILIQILMIGAALILSGRLALRSGSAGAALLFAASAMMTMITFFEAPIFFQFNIQTVLVFLTIVYASDGLATLRSARVPPAG